MLQRVSFNVGDAEVEGILHLPDGDALGGVAVLHGLSGGPEEPHIRSVCDALSARGVGALRFHFRATEGGTTALDSALADTAGALRLLRAHPALPQRTGVVGFGFGGAVAAVAAGRDSRLKVAVLGAAPALVAGSRRPLAEITRTRARVLLLRGSRDRQLPSVDAARYSGVLSQARVTHRVVTIEGGDHLFSPAGPRARMATEAAEWARESLSPT